VSDINVGSTSVSVTPDARDWNAKLRAQIEPGAREIGDKIGKDIGEAMYLRVLENVEKIRVKLDELGAKSVDVKVDVDDHGTAAATAAKVEAVGAAGSAGTGGLHLMAASILALGPAAIGMAAAAIPAILAVGAAAAGALAGAGVLALGFSGIGEALSASQQKPTGGGSGGGSNAALGQQSQQLSAKQATQQAADQLAQALQSQKDAETALTRAQRDAKDAQVALSTARKQAAQDIVDLDNKVKDNALAQREAVIKLAQAKQTLDIVNAAPGASLPQYAAQVAQAKLDYDKAQQALAELQLGGKRLAEQDKANDKAGVEGSKGVVDAKKKITDTNVALAKAQTNVTDTAHKTAEAQQNIIDTQLKNAIAAQRAANGMTAAAAGANAFGDAMAKLNPLQQEFVRFLLSLKPLFDQLKLAASGFLPGLQAGIQSIVTVFPQILQIVSNIAAALGGVFKSIGQQFITPEGQKFLHFLATELPGQITFLGNVFIQVGRIFSGVWEAFAPIIHALDAQFLGLLTNLGNAANGGPIQAFAKVIGDLLKQTAPVFKSIGGLLVEAFKAIAPAIGPSLQLVKILADTLTRLGEPVVKPLARLLGDLVTAFLPLLPVIGQLITTALPPMIDFLDTLVQQGIVPLVSALVDGLVPILPQFASALTTIYTALRPLIPPLAQVLVKAIQLMLPMLPQMVKAFADLAVSLAAILVAILPVLPPLLTLVAKVINAAVIQDSIRLAQAITQILVALLSVGRGIAGAVKTITDKFDSMIGFFTKLPDRISGATSGMFDGIKDAFRSALNWIIDGWNNLSFTLPSIDTKIPGVGKIGGWTLNTPDIPRLATGGMTNGPGTFVMGDNPGGREVALPLNSPQTTAALSQALAMAMANLDTSGYASTGHASGALSAMSGAGKGSGQGNSITNKFVIPQMFDAAGASHAIANRQYARGV
jgi:phage-related protein